MDQAQTRSAGVADASANQPETIKETLISIVIAFTMAFVFRGFVIEAFVIPTGSMAPTLLGAHMKFRGSETGVDWTVNPWDQAPTGNAEYQNPQDGRTLTRGLGPPPGITVYDPISGDPTVKAQAPLFSGDRILVLKYLYTLLDPRRYDVVVFKNPTDPSQNYIKRLIGLPGEELAIVDGDIFTRKLPATPVSTPSGSDWEAPGWTIARKPALQQRATWQTVFDSSLAPVNASAERTPWTAVASSGSSGSSGKGSFTLEGRKYTFTGGEGELVFDQSKSRISNPSARPSGRTQRWTIDDYYPYDEHPFMDDSRPFEQRMSPRYPVSDVRVRLAVEPAAGSSVPTSVTAKLAIRGHDFELSAGGGKAEIRMRAIVGGGGVKGEWKSVATGTCPQISAGNVTNLEFWHSDQALGVWVDGREVARYEYNWTPAERAGFATGVPFGQLVAGANASGVVAQLLDPAGYVRPEVRVAISGPACALYRVGLDRDLHYQPGIIRQNNTPAHGTSPTRPFVLGPDEFFCCGDNSPASLDGRLWHSVDPWVDYEFRQNASTPTQAGVVPRELMLGRAFFVYLPSIRYDAKPVPVPDFGRMRFIW